MSVLGPTGGTPDVDWDDEPNVLAFVVPCHQREELAGICMRQLARTCAALAADGLDATAVLIGDEEWVEPLAAELSFAFVCEENRPLGRKWNAGYEHACRDRAAGYVVPFGSDDAIDWRIIAGHLPDPGTVRASRLCALVSPDGQRLRRLNIRYAGGDGIRIYRTDMLERLGYRPAIDNRNRALDTSIVGRWIAAYGTAPSFVYLKSSYGQEEQLNGYTDCADHGEEETDDALAQIAEHYPAEFVTEIAAFYENRTLAGMSV